MQLQLAADWGKALFLLIFLGCVGWEDLRERLIWNGYIFAGIAGRLILLAVEESLQSNAVTSFCLSTTFSLLIVGMIYLTGWMINKEAVGIGDIKLLFVMACYLPGWELCVITVTALFILILCAIRFWRKEEKEYPFASAAFVAYVLYLFFYWMK